jgi:hypothetical protein
MYMTILEKENELKLLIKILLSIGTGIISALVLYFIGSIGLLVCLLSFNPLYILAPNIFGAIMRVICILAFLVGFSDEYGRLE